MQWVVVLANLLSASSLPTVVVDGSALNVSSPGSTLSVFSSGAAATANTALVSLDGTKENDVCSNRGSCDDSKLGKCNCYTGYTNSDGYGGISTTLVRRGDCGATSRIPVGCPGDLACSGHGTCSDTPNYRCACAVGWMGGDCADRVCPSDLAWFDYPVDNNIAHQRIRECSGVGNCDRSTGLCKCPAPYTGMACELSTYFWLAPTSCWCILLTCLSLRCWCSGVWRRLHGVLRQRPMPVAQCAGAHGQGQGRDRWLYLRHGPQRADHVGRMARPQLSLRPGLLGLRLFSACACQVHYTVISGVRSDG